MNKIKNLWNKVQNYAHLHEKSFHHAHNLTHMGYFGMVMTHGPYHVAAGALLVLSVLGWMLHLGEVEV